MSIFTGIQNVEHSFAGWAEKELSKLYGAAPKIEQVADTVLTYVGPALQTIVSLEAGAPTGALVGKVIQEAQAGLTAANGVIYDFGPSPTAASIIQSVKTNLSALLSASHVNNPASVANINQVISELDILVSAIGKNSAPEVAAPPTPTVGTNGAATATPPRPAAFPQAQGQTLTMAH